MDAEHVWAIMPEERRRVADLLESLTPAEWELPTPCEGWRVRDVAGHLTLAPNAGLLATMLGVLKARGDANRFIDQDARRRAQRSPAELVAEIRSTATSRRHPPPTKPLDPLVDVSVHGWDIATAAGKPWSIRTDVARDGAERIWGAGFPFNARKKLAGHRLVATDVGWTAGDGPEVIEAPIDRLLLLVTGRLTPQDA